VVITVNGSELEVTDISFKDRRKLHHLHTQAYFKSVLNGDGSVGEVKIDFDKFYEAMEFALSIAFRDLESEMEGKSDAEIDAVGQALVNSYLNPVKKNGN
jgi:hypothetical protein